MKQTDIFGWKLAKEIFTDKFYKYIRLIYMMNYKGKLNGEEMFILWFKKITIK